MNRAKIAFALLVVFFAGCAAERLLVVPPARAGTSPQRWEYFCKGESGEKDVTAMANQLGQQGWEMSASAAWNGPLWCFKRPLP